MVIPPANTGTDNNNSNTVKIILQANKGIRSKVNVTTRILYLVVNILTAPKIEDAPARCNLKMAKSTLLPECPSLLLKGG
jgi:hypothetical protein